MFISNWIKFCLLLHIWLTIEGVEVEDRRKKIQLIMIIKLSLETFNDCNFPFIFHFILWLEVGNWPTWSSLYSKVVFFCAYVVYISLDQSNLCSKNWTFLFMVIHMMLLDGLMVVGWEEWVRWQDIIQKISTIYKRRFPDDDLFDLYVSYLKKI